MSLINIAFSGNGNFNINQDINSNGQINLLIDKFTLDYVNRAKITDVNIAQNIDNFIIGLKEINLWDKFKNIWILRSGYNLPSGQSGFMDLKNPTFSGYSTTNNVTYNIDYGTSGYKFRTDSSIFFLSDKIILSGYNISLFSILESIKVAPFHLPFRTILSTEDYQKSGFRFGANETLGFRKWFSFWNGESTPNPANNINVYTNSTGQTSDYTFLSAGVINSQNGQYGQTGFIQANYESFNIKSGQYLECHYPIDRFPCKAGGTNNVDTRIAFFARSTEPILQYHHQLRDLTRSTIGSGLKY